MNLFNKFEKFFLKEMLALLIILLLALASIFFVFKAMSYTHYLFGSKDGIASLFFLILFLAPTILKMVIPFAGFFSALIVVIKMAQERELEGWFASGLSITAFLRAPLISGLLCSAVILFAGYWGEPYIRREKDKFDSVFSRQAIEIVLQNKVHPKTFLTNPFSTSGKNFSLYVEEKDRQNMKFKGVFIFIKDPSTQEMQVISAQTGEISREIEDNYFDLIFKLYNGKTMIYSVKDKKKTEETTWQTSTFEVANLSLVNLFFQDFSTSFYADEHPKKLYPQSFYHYLKQQEKKEKWIYNKQIMRLYAYFYEPLLIALGAIFIPLIAVLLGIHDPRRKTSRVLLSSGIILILFYGSIMGIQSIPYAMKIRPEWMFLPLIMMLLLIILPLLRFRLRYPPSTSFAEFLKEEYKTLTRRGHS